MQLPVDDSHAPIHLCAMPLRRHAVALAVLMCAPGIAMCQGAAGRPGFDVTAGVGLSQSWTDNRDLATTDRRSEALTILTPNVRVVASGERLRGVVDYALSAFASSAGGQGSDVQQSLTASLVAEPIQRTAFVDLRASIVQQSISAFGVQAASGPRRPAANQGEVRSVAMSPYLVGNVAGVVDLEARLTAQRTDTSGSQQGDTASRTSSVRATGGRASLRWSLAWVEENMRYDGSRSNAVQRLDGSVAYTPHYDWRLSARAGRERADVLALQAETRNSWGLGVNWKPSPRTELDANLDERYFGQGYRMLFGYRTPRTSWRITASRDVSSNSAFGVDASTVREYERLYELLASQIEDPVRRDLAVRELLGARTNVLTSSASVQRRIDVSGLWSGVRTSLAVSAYRSSTGRLDRASSAQDDLSRVTRLNQSGFDVSLGYRASPTGRVEMSWARRITGGGGSQPGNTLETTQLSWSEQLWRRASLVTSLRHTQFQADANPYTENGASLTFNLRF